MTDPTKQGGIRTKVGGGKASTDQQKVTRASAGGGKLIGNEQEDEGMEIKIVWGGTTEVPVPIVSQPRPRRSESPPLPERSWVAMPDRQENTAGIIDVTTSQNNSNQSDIKGAQYLQYSDQIPG